MARSFGRIFVTIWDEEEFQALSRGAQWLYMFLLSQPDLEHSGVIPLRARRWALSCTVLTPDVLAADLAELAAARYVIADEDTEEALVRSLIRNDEVWKQPNVFKSACRNATRVKSSAIRAALAAELERLDLSSAKDEVRGYRDQALEALANPSGNPSPTLPAAHREPAPEPSRRPRGKGEGLGEGSGEGKTPVAKASAREPAAMRALWPAVVPDEARDIQALTSEIQAIRRDMGDSWAPAAIERVLNDPAVKRRRWDEIRTAALAVARDPESRQPGRLAFDGPWWPKPTPRATVPRPEWCGECDQNTRMTGMDGGTQPRRCEHCHPLREVS